MITAKDFNFDPRPWKAPVAEIKAKGPLSRQVLSMKAGDSKLVTKEKCKGLCDAAYRRSIPHRTERQGNRWLFVRLG